MLDGYVSVLHPSHNSSTSATGSVLYATSSFSISHVSLLLATSYITAPPEANITVAVYSLTPQSYSALPTGAAMTTSVPINSSTIAWRFFQVYNFTFTSSFVLKANTYYGLSLQVCSKGLISSDEPWVNINFYNTSIPAYHVFLYQNNDWSNDAGAVDCQTTMRIYGFNSPAS
jgi:hypothetical protein